MKYLLFIDGRYVDTYSGTGPLLNGAHSWTRYGGAGGVRVVEYVMLEEDTLPRIPITNLGVRQCQYCSAISKRNGRISHGYGCPERE